MTFVTWIVSVLEKSFVSIIIILYKCVGCEQQQGCSVSGGCGDSVPSCRSLETTRSGVGSGGSADNQGHNTSQTQVQSHVTVPPVTYQQRPNSLSTCYASCCAESAKKVHWFLIFICLSVIIEENRKCWMYVYDWNNLTFQKWTNLLCCSFQFKNNNILLFHLFIPFSYSG